MIVDEAVAGERAPKALKVLARRHPTTWSARSRLLAGRLGKDACLVAISPTEIVVVGNSSWSPESPYLPLDRLQFERAGATAVALRGPAPTDHIVVDFDDPAEIEELADAIRDVSSAGNQKRERALTLKKDERLLAGLVFLGGTDFGLAPKQVCDAWFLERSLLIDDAAARVLLELPIEFLFSVEVAGRGKQRRGGGFIGGGFGLEGAAEGMAIAAVLNALTTRTSVETLLRVASVDAEYWFFTDRLEPQELRIQLAPVVGRIAGPRRTATAQAPQGLVAQLQQLAELHAAGALTDDEFARAKSRLLHGG